MQFQPGDILACRCDGTPSDPFDRLILKWSDQIDGRLPGWTPARYYHIAGILVGGESPEVGEMHQWHGGRRLSLADWLAQRADVVDVCRPGNPIAGQLAAVWFAANICPPDHHVPYGWMRTIPRFAGEGTINLLSASPSPSDWVCSTAWAGAYCYGSGVPIGRLWPGNVTPARLVFEIENATAAWTKIGELRGEAVGAEAPLAGSLPPSRTSIMASVVSLVASHQEAVDTLHNAGRTSEGEWNQRLSDLRYAENTIEHMLYAIEGT